MLGLIVYWDFLGGIWIHRMNSNGTFLTYSVTSRELCFSFHTTSCPLRVIAQMEKGFVPITVISVQKIKSVGYKRVMFTNKNFLHCCLFNLPSWVLGRKENWLGSQKCPNEHVHISTRMSQIIATVAEGLECKTTGKRNLQNLF